MEWCILVVTGTKLMSEACDKWNLEYLNKSVAASAPEKQPMFPVYVSENSRRVFRYLNSSKPDVPECYGARFEAMDFSRFCQLKQSSAAGEVSLNVGAVL